VNRIVLWAIERESVVGTYNATAPHAVRNEELMTALRVLQGRHVAFPLPAWAVRIGSLLLGTEPELILRGRRGVPRRLLAEGFRFQFPELSTALTDLLGSQTPEQRLREKLNAS
jgi:NAD dependent epimerase/dehydratase family enzyme